MTLAALLASTRLSLRPCLAVVWACALLAIASPLEGQIVRGAVLEDRTAEPVRGAMVLLLDADGRAIGRALTDGGGGFILRTEGPGSHALRVERIGYETVTTPSFDVPAGGAFQRVNLAVRAVGLEGLTVEAGRRCRLRGDQALATARVWDEARKALEAAAWTVRSGVYRYTLMEVDRTLGEDARSVVKEERRFARGTSRSPYVSHPVAELLEEGFIRRNPDGTYLFFAPDADALLSDAFLDTHCMRLARGRDGMLALEFEPVRNRRVPDIRGTLWLDAATAELRRLEFTYVNVPTSRDAGSAGGEIVFAGLPNGTWIVREWSIRMPMVAVARDASRMMVTGYQVQGGVVWRVADPGGATVLEAASASLSGLVVDSLGAPPNPPAMVRIAGAVGDSATTEVATDRDGAFFLAGLPPGLLRVEVRHPSLDSLRLEPIRAEVEGHAGGVAQVSLRIPGLREALKPACADAPPPERGSALVLARINRGAEPAAGASIRLRWLGEDWREFVTTSRAAPPVPGAPDIEWRPDPSDGRFVLTTLDQRGIFVMCHVPTPSRARVEVGDASGAAVRTFSLVDGPSVVVITFPLPGLRVP